MLPDIDGWTVLDRLKLDPKTRHIPVHIISAEEHREIGLKRGAFGHLTKPVKKEDIENAVGQLVEFASRKVKKLLVVEDNPNEAEQIQKLIGNDDVVITVVNTGAKAIQAIKKQHFDCMILDLFLPGMSGFEIIEKISEMPKYKSLPILIYTAKTLSKKEEQQLKKLARDIILKDVHSPERLLDEVSLFLHRVTTNLPPEKQKMLEKLYSTEAPFEGKKILVVDDDVRNIYAMTTALERFKLEIITAENGKQAIELLKKTPDMNIIIMDIMMPEMDGYETIREIRKNSKFKDLPIIALTAKAMKGDREKCIEAGASDYISKPVNMEQLVSMLRVWLYQ